LKQVPSDATPERNWRSLPALEGSGFRSAEEQTENSAEKLASPGENAVALTERAIPRHWLKEKHFSLSRGDRFPEDARAARTPRMKDHRRRSNYGNLPRWLTVPTFAAGR
jgi:hypothetical protein